MHMKVDNKTLQIIITAVNKGETYYIYPTVLGKRGLKTIQKQGFKVEQYNSTGFLKITK